MNPNENTPQFWRLAHLSTLTADQLADLTRRVVGSLTLLRLYLGRCLLALERSNVDWAFRGSVHYASLLGVPRRRAREAMRVAERLEELPVLCRAAENTEVSWSKLREVVRVATAETESEWLVVAQRWGYRRVERLVARARVGDRPGEASREPEEIEVILRLSPTAGAVWQRAMRRLSQEAGRLVSAAEALELLCADYLSGPVEEVLAEGEKDVEAEWAMVAAGEQDGLVAKADPHWANERLRWAGDQPITPAQRAEVLRRDGYSCQCPGCENRLWLEVHHVVFYCRGGATVPDNLIVVCWSCHRRIHQGWLRVSGQAPDGLAWTDRYGNELTPPGRLGQLAWLSG